MGTIPGPGFDSPQLHQKSNSRALAFGFFVNVGHGTDPRRCGSKIKNTRQYRINRQLELIFQKWYTILSSLTVNKHQSTGKPLNKGFLVLL